MKYVIAAVTLPEKCKATLTSRGFSVITPPIWGHLQAGVSAHPDMLLFFFGKNYLCSREYYSLAKDTLAPIERLGYRVILTNEVPAPDYPNDILFNSLLIGRYIFGLEKNISEAIRTLAVENSFEIVNVRQGYTKCSVCKVSDGAIITADKGIAEAAAKRGIDVLTVREGGVDLDGYDTGFIGGASGCDEETVYFCGNIMSHPDGDKIVKFCNKHKKECVSLSNEPLFDVGTLFFV